MSKPVIVNTLCGQLRGAVLNSFEDYDYCAFRGIPYAKPPVGELRFKDPLPAEPWSDVRDATSYGPSCGQVDIFSRTVKGSDDCLYLNVYVKSIDSENLLPVMVWIHGGDFTHGSADDLIYGPDYLLKKDIVLVTCNYRLGVLGFLNLDHEVAPGNQGLKDQIMALRWVQENIVNFGGDKNNVTIFGQSSGGASVHYLAISPLTKGLFHKAISQSGVASNPWAYGSDISGTYDLCKILGNESTDPKEIVDFLQTVELEKLIITQENVRKSNYKLHGTFHFIPGVDNKSKEPVVPIHPSKAAENGVYLPYMIGCTTREGFINSPVSKTKERLNLSEDEVIRIHFGDKKISATNAEKFVNFWGYLYFVADIHRVVATQVKKSFTPTYFYRFCYDKEFSLIKSISNIDMPGTGHFDDVPYQFGMNFYDILNLNRLKPGTKSYKVMEQMVQMWTNFVKYGKPTPTTSDLIPTHWPPVMNYKTFETLNINEELRMESVINVEEQLSAGMHLKYKL